MKWMRARRGKEKWGQGRKAGEGGRREVARDQEGRTQGQFVSGNLEGKRETNKFERYIYERDSIPLVMPFLL